MKKFIIFLFFFNNYGAVDFCDQLLMGLRTAINTIPKIPQNSLNLLQSNYCIGAGISAFVYLTYKDKKSIPFLRSIKNINIAKKQKQSNELYLKINNMAAKNNVCLLEKIMKVSNTFAREDAFENKLSDKIKDLTEDGLFDLIYPRMDVGEDKEQRVNCALREVFKNINNEENLSIFDLKNIKLQLKYYGIYAINTCELILLLCFGSFLHKNLL
jgi:hypothetical protein